MLHEHVMALLNQHRIFLCKLNTQFFDISLRDELVCNEKYSEFHFIYFASSFVYFLCRTTLFEKYIVLIFNKNQKQVKLYKQQHQKYCRGWSEHCFE